MPKLSPRMLAVIAVVVSSLLWAQSETPPVGSASIEGIVVNRVTGLGLPGFPVTLYTRQAIRYETLTGPDGKFRVTGMQPGKYESRVAAEGYTLFLHEPAEIQAEDNQTKTQRVEFTKQTTVRGRVVDADGKPVTKVQVRFSGVASIPVSDKGEFSIVVPQPGVFTVRAVPYMNGEAVERDGQRIAMVPTYFPSTITVTDAQTVVVRGDADVDGIEIRMRAEPVYRVRGRVLDENGAPQAKAIIRLVPVYLQPTMGTSTLQGAGNKNLVTVMGSAIGPGSEEAQVTSSDDGSFEFVSVRSGDWHVTAGAGGNINSPDYISTLRAAVAPVSVGRSDVDRVELRFSSLFSVTVGSNLPGPAPFLPRVGTVRLSPADGRDTMRIMVSQVSPANPSQANPQRSSAPPPSDGSFRLDGVQTGDYYMLPEQVAGYYPSAVMIGGLDVTNRPATLVPGSAPIRVLYKETHGVVRGRVTTPGLPSVVLLPVNLLGPTTGYFLPTKPDGSFEFLDLPPGDYYAAAFDHLDSGSLLRDPTILQRIAYVGKRVSVDTTSSVTVNLTAGRWPE